MSMSRRESTLAALTLVAVMVGSVLFLSGGQWQKFKDARRRSADMVLLMQAERDFIAQRELYETQDAELAGELPSFSADEKVDTHWMSVLSRIAAKHGFRLLKRDTGKEEEAGNARELAIDCREWRGTTEALVGFLNEVQSEGSSMDIRNIRIRKYGRSQTEATGRFTVYCAYTREEPDAAGVTGPNAGSTP